MEAGMALTHDEDATADLSEKNLSVSPVFIDFLSRWLDRSGFSNEHWPDQRSEQLFNTRGGMRSRAQCRFERLISDEIAQEVIAEVYQRFYELASGRFETMANIYKRHQFLAVVGLPRTGGSYLTAELFSALGYDPMAVPAAIAHDGFPEAHPISISKGRNAWLTTILSISEYMGLVELFFSTRDSTGPVYVPKKLTKAVYAGSFFNAVLGPTAEYFLTIRHPIASCISTYEKSGGLPSGGKFKVRSTIEKWIKRDLLQTGVAPEEVASLDYFTAYCRYWEQYYINLAMSGLTTRRVTSVIPFSKRHVEEAVHSWHARFGSRRHPTKFVSSMRLDARHPQWIERSEEALRRVAAVWHLVGLPFPADELAQCS
jgi:hypothetical protein